MGALRAAHGYPQPFNVLYWEVGNEDYFLTTVADYAATFQELYQTMKGVDGSIKIGAVAPQLP
jgi:alpha-L-arabinofuranosidase